MKTFTLISSLLLATLVTAWGQNYDDVYYQPSGGSNTSQDQYYNNGSQNNNPNPNTNTGNNSSGTSGYDYNQYNNDYGNPNRYDENDTYTDGQGNTYVTNNYYGNTQHDFYYSSRMRRFYDPYPGFGWYSGVYTDPYWYGYNDPWMWGSSIYVGSGFFMGPSWGMNIGWCSTSWHTAWAWNRGWNYGWGNNWYGGWGGIGWGGGWGGGWKSQISTRVPSDTSPSRPRTISSGPLPHPFI